MSDLITIKSTSLTSAIGKDISLRETSSTRLIFRPELVDNPHNIAASVRGTFIFQRKKPTGKWKDYKTLDLSHLKDKEWVKLEIKSEELYKFFTKLDEYYRIFQKYGIKLGETDFVVTPRNVKNIILSFLRNPENFTKLQELNIDDLKKLNLVSSINSLKNVLEVWYDNKTNSDEEFWQEFFKKNSWIIAQVFAFPVVLFRDKAYVGGKTIDNREGNIVDFIYKSGFIENILLVEIKTPITPLIGGEYRDGAFCLSSDLTGSVSQILKYKDEIQKNFFSLDRDKDGTFQVFDPKCMLIIGNIGKSKWDSNQTRSFVMQRHNFSRVEIITYDELFKKIAMLVKLLGS